MDENILKKAIKFFGQETQIRKIQEELLELALVLNQRECPTKDIVEFDEKLYDELADVKIMMAQAELIFDKQRINQRAELKLIKLNEKYLNGVIIKCIVCGENFIGEEPETCCSGHMCGCMGLPIEPPLCSKECGEVLFNKNKNIKRENT